MTRIHKHGFKSNRYLRVSKAQSARWAKHAAYSNDHSYFSVPNISNVSREEEVTNGGDLIKSTDSWKEGRRIVELDVLASGLKACKKCGLPLQLDHTISIQTFGLGCLLKIQCFNTHCMFLNSVPTGKRHNQIWDVNSKLATALVHSGLGERQANNFLSGLNIPSFSHKLVATRLKEVGNVVEDVAMESTNKALEEELAVVEEKNGKFVVAVDAGWQKRGSGRSYDSKSGHCSMVGPETGKIISYAIRSKDCRVCSIAESKKETPKDHRCFRNWEGSAKGMESDMVIEMMKGVQNKGCSVDAMVGDEDSTTIGRVKANVNCKIEKISDRNHLKKILGNSLYSLKKNHPILTVKVIKYLQRCFNYILAQGEEKPDQIADDIRALSKHPFGDHQCCSSRWCKFLTNPNCIFKSFPHGRPLSSPSLQKSIENVLEGYAQNSIKLSRMGSTQINESFNRMVAAKAPKTIHYSSSGNLNYRVAASVAQKNLGHRYVVNINKKLGLSPGAHTLRLARLRDYQRSKQRAIATSRAFKRKRLEKKAKMYQKTASVEVREGVEYQPGCCLVNALVNDIKTIPAPVSAPEHIPVPPDVMKDCCITFFDVETTGLARDSHITQLSAINGFGESVNTFNTYIKPGKNQNISPQAQEVTGLKYENGKLYHNNIEVEAVSIKQGLQRFTQFLSKSEKPIILCGHNARVFDVPVFLTAILKNNELEALSSSVTGFVDSLLIFKELFPTLASYSQPAVYRTIFNEIYNAHDAKEDVLALARLFKETCPNHMIKSKHSSTVESAVKVHEHFWHTKSLRTSLDPLVEGEAPVITKTMARKIASSGLGLGHLKLAHSRDRQSGIRKLFTEICPKTSKVRVTKLSRIIVAIQMYLNGLEE